MAPDQLAGTLGPEHVINGASGDLRLKGGRCAACGGLAFPKPGICSGCLCEDIADVPVVPEGVLYAYSGIMWASGMICLTRSAMWIWPTASASSPSSAAAMACAPICR